MKSFEELSLDERYSMRYNLIVLAEALAALCLHISIEEYLHRASSYRDAVQTVAKKLKVKCVKDLSALIGLRNLLIHRYWNIDDGKVYEMIKGDLGCVMELINRIREELID